MSNATCAIPKFSSELKELSFSEATMVNGGESLWYWLAYGVTTVMIAGSHGPSEYDRMRRETDFGK